MGRCLSDWSAAYQERAANSSVAANLHRVPIRPILPGFARRSQCKAATVPGSQRNIAIFKLHSRSLDAASRPRQQTDNRVAGAARTRRQGCKNRVLCLSAYEGPVHVRRSAITAVLFTSWPRLSALSRFTKATSGGLSACPGSRKSGRRSTAPDLRFRSRCNRKASRLNLSLHRVSLSTT